MTDNIDSERLWKACDVSWNHSDFTISAFGGKLRLSPEFMEDIKAYYNISEADIFSCVSHALKKNNLVEEVDVKIEMLPSFFAKKESMFSIAVFESANRENVLARYYFSSRPATNLPENYPFPRLDEESETNK